MIISLKENKSSRQFLYLYSNNKPNVKRYPKSTMDIILWIQITMDTLNISFLIYRRYFSSVAQSCPTLCNPMDYSTPGFPVHHQLPESTQTYVHWFGDAIQPSHPLSSPFSSAFNLSQNQVLFQWVSSLHQVAKILARQLQHKSFQWIFRVDFL